MLGASVRAKLKVFLWRLAQHSIPTLEIFNHMNIADTPYCALCGIRDSWKYALVECSMARASWTLAKEEMVEHTIMTNYKCKTVARFYA